MGDANGVVMHGCGLCGGVWLDNVAAQRVSQRYDERVVDLAGRARENATVRPDTRAVATCPACRREMGRRTFGQISIDYCDHGTWFDAGELAALLQGIRPPTVPVQYNAPAPAPSWGATAGSAVLNTAGNVAVDVAENVAVGAFELLISAILD
jgi:Zn-finger nucleic acid-binding protein